MAIGHTNVPVIHRLWKNLIKYVSLDAVDDFYKAFEIASFQASGLATAVASFFHDDWARQNPNYFVCSKREQKAQRYHFQLLLRQVFERTSQQQVRKKQTDMNLKVQSKCVSHTEDEQMWEKLIIIYARQIYRKQQREASVKQMLFYKNLKQ